jgi:hypothetical protein
MHIPFDAPSIVGPPSPNHRKVQAQLVLAANVSLPNSSSELPLGCSHHMLASSGLLWGTRDLQEGIEN